MIFDDITDRKVRKALDLFSLWIAYKSTTMPIWQEMLREFKKEYGYGKE